MYYVGGMVYGNELYHHGILGMKWGVRRYRNEDGTLTAAGKKRYAKEQARNSKKLRKLAQKDAKKYVDAKMYYGEGAGNRRKLLKGELSNKMKNSEYKSYFDEAVNNADYARSAKKAVRDRHIADTKYQVGKKYRAFKRYVLPALVSVGTIAAGLYYAKNKDTIDAFILDKTTRVVDAIKQAPAEFKRRSDAAALNRLIKQSRRAAESMNRGR